MGLLSFFNKRKTTPADPNKTHSIFSPRRTPSGVAVGDWNAAQYSAVWACLKVIGEDIAILPWGVFEKGKQENRTVPAIEHPAHALLNRRPNNRMAPFTMKELLVRDGASYGNGFAEIARDNMGRPAGLFYIHPSRVKLVREEETGRYLYEVTNNRQDPVYLEETEMFHLRGPSADGLMGYSVYDMARNTIGLALAAEQHGATWFGSSIHLSGTLSVPAALDATARAELRDEWAQMYKGAKNRFSFAILDNGAIWNPIQSSAKPSEVQNLETRKYQVIEVCRFFRVPPFKIFSLEDAKFANIEEQSIGYFRDTLLPWITRLEEEANLKLLGTNKHFTRFDVKQHNRGRMTDQANYFATMSKLAALSPNEIREDIDKPPIKDGDNYFLQAQYRTLDQIVEGEELKAEPVQPTEVAPDENTGKPPPGETANAED